MEYEGWKNKQTWLVNIWFDEILTRMQDNRIPVTVDFLKELVNEYIDMSEPASFAKDLMTYAVAGIDWHSLEEHWSPLED